VEMNTDLGPGPDLLGTGVCLSFFFLYLLFLLIVRVLDQADHNQLFSPVSYRVVTRHFACRRLSSDCHAICAARSVEV